MALHHQLSSCDLIAGSNKKYEMDSAVEPQNDTSIELHLFYAISKGQGCNTVRKKLYHLYRTKAFLICWTVGTMPRKSASIFSSSSSMIMVGVDSIP